MCKIKNRPKSAVRTVFYLGSHSNRQPQALAAPKEVGQRRISPNQNKKAEKRFLAYGLRLTVRETRLHAGQIAKRLQQAAGSARQAVLLTLAITLLNPHVYLDTVVIVGGIAGTLSPAAKALFLCGAVAASALWFFALGFGARLLLPLFRRPLTWRLLDAVIGVVMWAIAFSLLRYAVALL